MPKEKISDEAAGHRGSRQLLHRRGDRKLRTTPHCRHERNEPPAPNQITIGQMYVQFQIPARKKRGAAGHHGARFDTYGGLPGIDAGWT